MLTAFKRVPQIRAQSRATVVAALCGDLDLAVRRGQELLETWPEPRNPLDRWWNGPSLARLRTLVAGNVEMWAMRQQERNRLSAQLQAEMETLAPDPFDRVALLRIEQMLARAAELGSTPLLGDLDRKGQEEGERRQRFRKIFKQACAAIEARAYKEASRALDAAERLYAHEVLSAARRAVAPQLEAEGRFVAALETARALMAQQRYQAASRGLSSALEAFPRTDGQELLVEANRHAQEQRSLLRALEAEHEGRRDQAMEAYEAMIADPVARIRRAILLYRMNRPEEALMTLEIARGDRARYWRGFLAAQLGQAARALQEWEGLDSKGIQAQRRQLEAQARRAQLLSLRDLEEQAENRQWADAIAHARRHEQQFGCAAQLTFNLEQHLMPQLELEQWHAQDGAARLASQRSGFIRSPSANRLHNWFACAYQVASSDRSVLSELTSLWHMVLANLDRYPAQFLQLEPVAMIRPLETLVREDAPALDRFRTEALALELSGTPPRQGFFMGDFWVAPGLHAAIEPSFLKWRTAGKAAPRVLEVLYTNWGPAVAACLAGDLAQAIALKPAKASTTIERFGECLIALKVGLSALRNGSIKEAQQQLIRTKDELPSNPEWRAELEATFQARQGATTETADALALSECWRQVLDSSEARAYWVEMRAREISRKLGDELLSEAAALKELDSLLMVDSKHALALEIKRRIEELQDLRAVFQSLEAGRFQEAVQRARRARHDSVRQTVAERLILIAVEGLNNRMHPAEAREIVELAHQIRPNDPEFREVFRAFRVG